MGPAQLVKTAIMVRVYRWAGLGFFAIAILYAGLLLRGNPLPVAAVRIATAMRDGDGPVLYDFAIQDERSCSELTPDKIRKAWEILIGPLLAQSRPMGADGGKLAGNQTQATASYSYLDREGNPWKLVVIANQTDDGAKDQIIYTMLATASLFDDAGHAQATLTSDLSLKGLHRFRAPLEAA